MAALLDGLSWALLMGGSFFVLTGALGLLRLPDVYARMHAAGVTDTLGAGLFLAGLAIQGGLGLVTVKLAMILAFILFTSPTATYALANAVFSSGANPAGKDGRDCATRDGRDASSKS
jgi:multicomponent Na+:H+ antiporter subunit G